MDYKPNESEMFYFPLHKARQLQKLRQYQQRQMPRQAQSDQLKDVPMGENGSKNGEDVHRKRRRVSSLPVEVDDEDEPFYDHVDKESIETSHLHLMEQIVFKSRLACLFPSIF